MSTVCMSNLKQILWLMLALLSATQASDTLSEHHIGASTIHNPSLANEYLLGDPPDSLPLQSLWPKSVQATDGKSFDFQIKVEPHGGSRFIYMDKEALTLNWSTNDISEVGDYNVEIFGLSGHQKWAQNI